MSNLLRLAQVPLTKRGGRLDGDQAGLMYDTVRRIIRHHAGSRKGGGGAGAGLDLQFFSQIAEKGTGALKRPPARFSFDF